MIDTENEELISLSEASRRLPSIDGKPVHPATIFRWCTDGVRGGDVRLDHARVGRRILTSVEALDRFRDKLEGPREKTMDPAPRNGRSDKQRAADVARAEKALARHGV